MQTLGYIVTKGKIKGKFDFVKVVNDFSQVECGKPYLIVGLSEVKKITSDNFSILDKSLGNDCYWTFGRTEKRDEFEKDVISFYNNLINNNINKIKYIYINILNINFNILKRLVKLFNKQEKKYIYIWNDMVYVLCKDNCVIGISLRIASFCGYNSDKIVNKIKQNRFNIICNSDECISKNLKLITKDKQYVIPYIMSIMEY